MPTWTKVNKGIRNQFFPANDTDHQIDWKNDTIKVALVQAGSGAPNTGDAGVETWADVKAANAEVSGTNYTAGGFTLTISHSLASGTTTLTISADPNWAQSASGFSNARYAVLYADKGIADSDKPVAAILDLGGLKGNVDGPLTIDCTANELLSAA